jgi:hypothetical protein
MIICALRQINTLYIQTNSMRLISIILESDAAEEAKRMGLVKKPGVGLYGPPDGPVSHMSRQGKLIPIKTSQTSAGQTSSPQTTASAPQNNTDARPTEKPSSEYREVKAPPPPDINKLAQQVWESLSPDGEIEDIHKTLSVITSGFGRETVAPVHKINSKEVQQRIDDSYLTRKFLENISGAYDHKHDSVIVAFDYPISPITEWAIHETRAMQVHIHEALHSARWKPDYMPPDSPDFINHFRTRGSLNPIDEGMTEYITHELLSAMLGSAIRRDVPSSYPVEIRAVSFMVKYGELDVPATYMNKSYTIEGENKAVSWDYVEKIRVAHNTAFMSMLRKMRIDDSELVGIKSMLEHLEKRKSFPLFDPEVSKWLYKLETARFNPSNPPLSMNTDEFLNQVWRGLDKSLTKVLRGL